MNDRPLPTTYLEWLDRAREQATRFWSKTKRAENGCLLWQGGKDKDGYGKFQITGRSARFKGDRPVQKHVRAHKLAYELKHGPVPAGLVLRHSCDTPACCDETHLKPGTQGDNRRDCVARGREPRGVDKPMSTINDDIVRAIRELKAQGYTCAEITRILGITHSATYGVFIGKTWRHVA